MRGNIYMRIGILRKQTDEYMRRSSSWSPSNRSLGNVPFNCSIYWTEPRRIQMTKELRNAKLNFECTIDS